MTSKIKLTDQAVDCAAAGVLAGAVGFAAAVLGSAALAALLAPLAFCVAYAVLCQVESEQVHRLAGFEPRAFDRPRHSPKFTNDGDTVIRLSERIGPTSVDGSAGDAGQALSDALAALKRSLR